MNNPEQLLGIIAGVLTAIAQMPQLIKVIKEKKADDISVVMILVLIAGLGTWIWYGALKKDLPIVLTNAFSVLTNTSLLICAFYYKSKS